MAGSERLKEIKLVVSDKYETPDLLTKCDPTINEEVLSLGVTMYRKQASMLLEMGNKSLAERLKKEHTDELKELMARHSREVSQLRADSTELSANHAKKVSQLETEKEALEMSVKNLQEKSSDLIEFGFERASTVHADRLKEKEKYLFDQIEDLRERRRADIEEKESRHKELMGMLRTELNNQMKQKEEEHKKITETLNQHIQDLKKALEKSQAAESVALQEYSQRLQRLTGTSSVIGQVGEQKLDAFIRSRFATCTIERTAYQTASADMLVTIESLKLTVESKNVMKLDVKEIEKFWVDIDNLLSSKKVNAGLFISWKNTDLHAGNKHFAFEYEKGIPVIYISDAEGNPELITFSIRVLLSLVKNGMTLREHDGAIDDWSKYAIDLVRDLHADYVVYDKMLKNEREIISKLNAQLKVKENLHDSMTQKFENAIRRYPNLQLKSAAKKIRGSKPKEVLNDIASFFTATGDQSGPLSEHQIPADATQGMKRKSECDSNLPSPKRK